MALSKYTAANVPEHDYNCFACKGYTNREHQAQPRSILNAFRASELRLKYKVGQ
jgi:hypothetical protein